MLVEDNLLTQVSSEEKVSDTSEKADTYGTYKKVALCPLFLIECRIFSSNISNAKLPKEDEAHGGDTPHSQ